MSILNAENITHSFGGRQILEDASFKLNKGEHVGHGSDPIPLTDEEVARMGIEKVYIDLDVEIGDTVVFPHLRCFLPRRIRW